MPFCRYLFSLFPIISRAVIEAVCGYCFCKRRIGNKSGTKSVQQSVSQQLDSCPYRLRLCHLKMTSRQSVTVACESQGDTPCYGFMLRSGSGHGRTGQYVGEVDPGSIAERAGLKVGDRVIEVNGFNVETESHREVCNHVTATQQHYCL